MRRKLIAANWKMFKNAEQAREFMHAFVPMLTGHTRDEVVICPPFTCIETVAELATAPSLGVGAQDMYWEREGAYTGEVSGPMLLAAGCTHVIIGHSERRQYFGETDATVNKKIRAALEVGLTPIVCVGEVLQEREAGLTDDVLRRQCVEAFRELSGEQGAKMTVAYEPVWAIGTGKTATPQIAAAAHEVIRAEAAEAFGQ